jgi:hypothetical protein
MLLVREQSFLLLRDTVEPAVIIDNHRRYYR